MKIVLIGPPGCGKGTQAVLIHEECGIPHLSTGEILRTAVREKTPLGREAEAFMKEGRLGPDDLIVRLMKERMGAGDCRNGYILDGFPRTLPQAEAFDRILKDAGDELDAVISIEIDDEEVVRRLTGRRQCSKCGEGYHLEFKRPKADNVCDKCGGALYQRDDDNEDTVRSRLAIYRRQTKPLLSYYKKAGLLKSVNGIGTIDDIFKSIGSLINGRTPRCQAEAGDDCP